MLILQLADRAFGEVGGDALAICSTEAPNEEGFAGALEPMRSP